MSQGGNHEHLAKAVSNIFGWIYFLCWSLSFYPQPILNWQRKSTIGVSIDFPTLNVLGFICLTVSSTAFIYSPEIRREYAARNPKSPEPTVQLNDLAYAVHALILSIIIYTQFWPVGWGFKVGKFQRASKPILGVFWGCVLVVIVAIIKAASQPSGGNDATKWAWIDVIYTIGYVKLIVTVVKYIPQAWLNYQRKSTVGWSIVQILLDFVGGVLSILQLIIDASQQGDWSGVTANPIKFGLGNITIIFDVVFIVQHYLLYPHGQEGDDKEEEEEEQHDEEAPLLNSSQP